jgi:hypothetical protein
MGHCRPHRLDARIIEFHANLAMKDLQQGAFPILHYIVMRGKALVDKLPQVISDLLASVPVGTPRLQTASSAKQSKPLPKVLSSISFHIANSHNGAAVFVRVIVSMLSSSIAMLRWDHRSG